MDRTEIIPVKLDDDTDLYVSAVVLPGEEDVAIGEVFFSGVMSTVKSLSSSLVKTLQKVNPDKASVEFGFALAAKEGKLTALLVQGSGEASIKITLEWTKDEKKPKAGG